MGGKNTLMIGFLKVASGEKERTLYAPDNQPQWKDTTIYYSLDIVIHVGMWAQNKYMR